MVPSELKLSNFTSYGTKVPTLDFRQFHMAAISGQNGAGKSSLLDSITWCLWGTSRLGDNADQLIRLGQHEMFVEFSFQLDGSTYTVKRKRVIRGSTGTSSLEFFNSTHNLTEGTIKTTQQKIIDVLRLSYETFVNSAFIRQGHADEFTTKGATDRKRILADILGLANYDALEEKAKEKAKEAQTHLTLLDYQLLEIEAELSQKEEREKALSRVEAEAKEIGRALKEVEGLIREIEKEREAVSVKQKALEEKSERIKKAQTDLQELKLQISLKEKAQQEFEEILSQKAVIEKNCQKLSELKEEKKVLDNKRSELIKIKDEWSQVQKILLERKEKRDKEVTKLQVQIKELQTQNDQKLEQNEQLKKRRDSCPTCGQPIGQEKNKEIIAANIAFIKDNDTKIKELQDKCNKYIIFVFPEETQVNEKESRVKKLEEETKNYFTVSDQINELSKYEGLNIKLQQAEATVKVAAGAIEDLKKIYQTKEDQVQKESAELNNLENLEKELSEVQERLSVQEVIKEGLAQRYSASQGNIGAARQLVDRATQLQDLFQKKGQEKNKLKQDKDNFEELALAFGKKGIQAMIIETAIPEIENEANSLLDRLTEGRMKVRLDTQKETKAGTTVETLDIVISDEMGERSYEGYSVDGNELVYVRKNKKVFSLPIKDLWLKTKRTIVNGQYQFQEADIETLCYVKGKASWKKVDKILRHKTPDKILEVKCGPGNYSVKLTKNHSIFILTPEGIKVKRTEDLIIRDYLLSPRIIPEGNYIDQIDLTHCISEEFKNQRTINLRPLKWDDCSIWSRSDQKINRYIPINEDWGKFIGIAVAEGSGKTAYSIAAGSNRNFAQEAINLASRSFGTKIRSLRFVPENYMKQYIQTNPGISSISPRAQYRPIIGGRLIAHIMKNMVGEKAYLKKIPSFIFNSPKKIKLAFLRGLIEGDGYIKSDSSHSKSEIGITTVSPLLAGEIVFLCRQLGIWARIENHGQAGFKRGMNHQKSYRIVISGKNNLEILELGKIVTSYDLTTKYEGIPHSLTGITRTYKTKYNKRFPRNVQGYIFNCGVRKIPQKALKDYNKIQGLVEEWNILEVNEIKEVSPTSDYVYDLMVPENNSFVAGTGMILVHNSGGEQFRVNLAIRLALSKLLTHRAGSKLQFLVIDEGFGTQDTLGRSKIIEALSIIKNDFEKIVIITHLDELKEEFPVRVEVNKGPEGSTFEVVGA